MKTSKFYLIAIFILSLSIGYSANIYGPSDVCDGLTEQYYIINESCSDYEVSWEIIPSTAGVITQQTNGYVWIAWNFNPYNPNAILKATVDYIGYDCSTYVTQYPTLNINILGLSEITDIYGQSPLKAGINVEKWYSCNETNTNYNAEQYHFSINGDATYYQSNLNSKQIKVTTDGCEPFTILVYSSTPQNDCDLETETFSRTIYKELNSSDFSISGFEDLCKYPLGTYQSTYSIQNNSCVTYYWYTQLHSDNQTKGGGTPIYNGVRRLEIVGDNDNNTVLVKAVKSGESKLYCRVSYGSVTFIKEFLINICEDPPGMPPFFAHDWSGKHYLYEDKPYYIPTVPGVTIYKWEKAVDPGGIKISGSGSSEVSIQGKQLGTWFINTQMKNICGWGTWRIGTSCNQYVWIEEPEDEKMLFLENEIDLSEISVYPNPAGQYLNIVTPSEYLIDRIVFYDIVGKEVYHIDDQEFVDEIDISNLPNGIYIINIIGDRINVKHKINISK